ARWSQACCKGTSTVNSRRIKVVMALGASTDSRAVTLVVPLGRVPDRDLAAGPGAAGRGEAPAVGAEGDAHDGACGIAKGRNLVTARRVPDLDRAAPARRRQAPAVGTERHTEHPVRMTAEPEQAFPGASVPDRGGSVPARGGQARAVGAEGNAVD